MKIKKLIPSLPIHLFRLFFEIRIGIKNSITKILKFEYDLNEHFFKDFNIRMNILNPN